MKNKYFMGIISIIAAWSNASFGQTCYDVEGDVNTINVSPVTQVGTIDLLLLDASDNEAYRESAQLIGNITGANMMNTFLSHQAMFEDGGSFITDGDTASITAVRKITEDDGPCSFYIDERITRIVSGTGFFSGVSSVKIDAKGYISACINDGENENEFELSGQLCVD